MALNRPDYRDAKTPRAVTVYTIAQESRHILFTNLPALSGEESLIQDLVNKCRLYGTVETWRRLDPSQRRRAAQPFTLPPILMTFATIAEARWVKCKMDDQVFYANLLQVDFAPEYDTLTDLRNKFEDRRARVFKQISLLSSGGKKQRRVYDQPTTSAQLHQSADSLPIEPDTCLTENRKAIVESSVKGTTDRLSITGESSVSNATKRRRI